MVATSDRFLACLPYTLVEEGGNSNDPHDPGGRTHNGIIQREYDRYRKGKGLPLQSVYLASNDEVKEIYWTEYWLPHCPSLAVGLDLVFFDQCVNEGPFEAIKLLQRTLGLRADGVWGSKTQFAVDHISNLAGTISVYCDWRSRFYRSLGSFQYFGKGWLHRTEDIRVAAVNMAKGQVA